MNKVVYNACYGGYSLSDEAMELYGQLAGIKLFPVKDRWGSFWFLEESNGRTADEMFKQGVKDFDNRHTIERHDPILIQVVETLGDKANGKCAKLRIAELSGRQYRVDEYDGYETVVEPDGYDWKCI